MTDEDFNPLIPLLGHLLYSIGAKNLLTLSDKSEVLADLLRRIKQSDAAHTSVVFSDVEVGILHLAFDEFFRWEEDDFETIIGMTPAEVRAFIPNKH